MGKKSRSQKVYPVDHPFIVMPAEEGGYFILFPDLPGCMTQVEDLKDLPHMASDAWAGWISTCIQEGWPIPKPTDVPEALRRKHIST